MPRLTPDELRNLSNNLKAMNQRLQYSSTYVSQKTGISKRTYEAYLYGEKSPKLDNLEKLADFYSTTIAILISSNMVIKDIEFQKGMRDYKPIWDAKTSTDTDKIISIIEKLCGKRYGLLLRLIQNNDIYIRFMPTYNTEKIDEYIKKKYASVYKDNKTLERMFQHHIKSYGKQSLTDRLVQEDNNETENIRIKSSYDDSKEAINLFIDEYKKGIFDDIPIDDIPLEISFIQFCENPTMERIRNFDTAEDFHDLCKDYTMQDFLYMLDDLLEMMTDCIFEVIDDEMIK